ncbi:MAG: formate/nitrite transporter family protein [Deltaproteobacteria bacterium]|nr:formate/nitrite transporter family protein [Deltaproteobacteria bacterium]
MTDLYLKNDENESGSGNLKNTKTVQDTIAWLQKYLAAEVAGRDLYIEQTKTLNDPILVQALKSFASTESGHIINIREKITELGGTPKHLQEIREAQKGVSEASHQVSAPLDMLRIDLKIEENAINDYTAGLEVIEDPGVRALLENNLAEEIHHSLYLSKRINEILESTKARIGAIRGIEKPGGKEASEIFKASVEVGQARLQRSWLEMSMSGLIAGMNVTFGIIASSYVAGATAPFVGANISKIFGALFFPIGFMFLMIGKSELFTENFLVPVTAVIAKRGKISDLLKLWSLTLIGNMAGIFIFALVIAGSLNQIVPQFVVGHIHGIADNYMSRTPFVMVLSAIFAGWLITLMTWLLIASSGTLARIFIIWVVGFMIYLNSFSHIVVASSEILIAINTGSHISYLPWLYRYVPLTIIGNMIGGLFFVTILQYLQILHAASPAPDEHFSSSSYELDMMGGGSRTKTAEMENVENIEDTI